MGLTLGAAAATRNDVLVLESSEALQTNTQSLAIVYLLAERYPDNGHYKELLDATVALLNENIQKISLNTNDAKTKGLLSYFATKKTEIVEMLSRKPGTASSDEIVSISEIFTEGSKSIAKQHTYPFSFEEKMQMLAIEMQTKLNEILKYHLAMEANTKDTTYQEKRKKAITAFDKEMNQLEHYPYRGEMKETLVSLKHAWQTLKHVIEKKHALRLPALLTITGNNMQKELVELSVYHAQKQ